MQLGLSTRNDAEQGEQKLLYLLLSIGLVLAAGLMSGLTLGLMSMDSPALLQVLLRSGTDREKRYAKRIEPVVRRPHYTLVTLLLCNAIALEALPIFLDRLVSPVTAIVLSVTVVLVFGEIFPQAVCQHHGLVIGAYSAWFVRLLMLATAPVSWPISKVLDYLLGEDNSALFRRAQLKALVDLHRTTEGLGGQLADEEINVIRGALDLTNKTAMQGMTALDKVFMLPADARCDEETLTAVLKSGHSRLPIHKPGNKKEILGLILVKELITIDQSKGLPLSHVRMRSLPFLRGDTAMYDLLKLFQTGRSHMVVLTQPPALEDDDGDAASVAVSRKGSGSGGGTGGQGKAGGHPKELCNPVGQEGVTCCCSPAAGTGTSNPSGSTTGADLGEPIGIITIEDVLEELLQQEIVDETDRFVDNEQSEQVNAALLLKDLPPTMREALKVRVGLARTRSGRMATTQVRVRPVHVHPLPVIQVRLASVAPL
eukprot:jgi/Astpho2/1823/e_gw1.00038.108.1_t